MTDFNMIITVINMGCVNRRLQKLQRLFFTSCCEDRSHVYLQNVTLLKVDYIFNSTLSIELWSEDRGL